VIELGRCNLSEALPERKRQGDGLRNAIALAAALKCRGLRIARAGGAAQSGRRREPT